MKITPLVKFALLLSACLVSLPGGGLLADEPGLVLSGGEGPGKGKHVVLIAGDDEYRSEELIPQFAKILAQHHGFKCTVLFSTNPKTGEIDPSAMENIPGLEVLKTADLMVLFVRFRELPDDQMKQIIDYTESGRPIIALRTTTHPFNYTKHKKSPYAKYTFNSREYPGGYGRQVLGETWVNHHGWHQKESTRGLIAPGMENHPIVRGVEDIWGPSDVYTINSLTGDSKPIVLGQVLEGMSPSDKPNTKKATMPVLWTKTYTGGEGKAGRVCTTTMGHAGDFQNEGFRRLMINASYWCVGLQEKIPAKSKVDLVGKYDPNPIGTGKFKKGLKPADFK